MKMIEDSTMLEEMDEMLDKFMENSNIKEEEELLEGIHKVFEALGNGPGGGGFSNWPAEKLIAARERLARFSEPLGDKITDHETSSDFAYIWRKGKFAADWQPMKTKIQKGLTDSKATISDVESALTEKYMNEQYYTMFHRRRADFLHRRMQAVDRMIRSIDQRLRELGRQWQLPQTEGIQKQ